jgi:high-affinity iron transporter
VISTFLIFLREGVEALMIVAILLSYLDKINQRARFRDVFWGVGLATVLMIAAGIGAYEWIGNYDGSNIQTYFETATYLVAVAVLSGMTLWMAKHARTIASELKAKSDAALSKGSRWGMGVLAFQAIFREGLETVVFTLAIIFASAHGSTAIHGHGLLIGALLGLLCAIAMSYATFKLGAKLNLKIFFRVLGVTLMILAAGLLTDAIQNMQSLGWLPRGGTLWNSTGMINEQSNIGDTMHSLLGYAERPSVLQAVAWVLYVGVSLSAFLYFSVKQKKRDAA